MALPRCSGDDMSGVQPAYGWHTPAYSCRWGSWKVEAWPLRLSRVPPAGSSLLTAAASPSQHAQYSAWAGMCGMILRLESSRGAERVGGGGEVRDSGCEATPSWAVSMSRSKLPGCQGCPSHTKPPAPDQLQSFVYQYQFNTCLSRAANIPPPLRKAAARATRCRLRSCDPTRLVPFGRRDSNHNRHISPRPRFVRPPGHTSISVHPELDLGFLSSYR